LTRPEHLSHRFINNSQFRPRISAGASSPSTGVAQQDSPANLEAASTYAATVDKLVR
jgi:hypothetical protein